MTHPTIVVCDGTSDVDRASGMLHRDWQWRTGPMPEHITNAPARGLAARRTMRPRISVSFFRAFTLRCPRCGGRSIFKNWLHLRAQCPTCALAFERGEDEDYWYGGVMFNVIAAELLTLAAIVVWVIATLPDVPWTLLQFVGPALAVVVPFLTYPFARCVWLAWDLAFRPTEPGD